MRKSEMETRTRVAIIGAGCAGLAALKNCLEYGFDAACLEKTNDVGGVWRYKPEECEGESSVMKSTIANTSKEMMAFSDFPPPANFPNYMPNSQYLAYLRLYVAKFDLLPHIRFNTLIVSVDREDDYDGTGRWKVTTKNLRNGEIVADIYNAVMLCTGHYVDPYIPPVKGLHQFEYGRVLHSRSYKDFHGFEDKRVVVVGMGNSGCDIAVELTQVANKVFLATNHGNWVASRLTDYGYPADLVLATRFQKMKAKYFEKFASAQKEDRLSRYFDHAKYGIKPHYHAYQQISLVNEYLPHCIISGRITMKPAPRELFADGRVLFEDGSGEEKIDAVIFATGFSFSFPYVENGKLIPAEDNRVRLYKHMFCPQLTHPETLAIIGFVQPGGSHIATAEMQSRFACELLSKESEVRLPSRSKMNNDIEAKLEEKRRLFGEVGRRTIVENYMEYVDDLAALIGVKPNPLHYLAQDPTLAFRLFFGPFLPYQFRLRGPKAWPEAREAIVSVWDRVWFPTRQRIRTAEKGVDQGSRPAVTGEWGEKHGATNFSTFCLIALSSFLILFFLAISF